MNEKISTIVNKYKKKSYDDLKKEINQNSTYEFEADGKQYTLEVNVLWDDKPNGTIRIAAFTNYVKKKWWQTDKAIYSALVKSD